MMPIILSDDYEKVDQLIRHIEILEEWCDISNLPMGCKKNRRCSCYGLCFRPLFGSTKQMGLILAKTFEGNPIKIRCDEDPSITLDCMFFTSTCE